MWVAARQVSACGGVRGKDRATSALASSCAIARLTWIRGSKRVSMNQSAKETGPEI